MPHRWSLRNRARRVRRAWLCLATWGWFQLAAPLVHARFHELLGLHPAGPSALARPAAPHLPETCPIAQVQQAAGLPSLAPSTVSLDLAEPAATRGVPAPRPGLQQFPSARAPPALSTV